MEKTLAELDLLQMQKRILRAQGEREKAASIKKKQRGLLLRLQEERAKIESLRKMQRKDAKERKHSGNSDLYESSSWETDWSAAAITAATADSTSASVNQPESALLDSSVDTDRESSLTLQPVTQDLHVFFNYFYSFFIRFYGFSFTSLTLILFSSSIYQFYLHFFYYFRIILIKTSKLTLIY